MAYKPANWEAKFLELYKATGNVTLSAHGAGIDRNTVYQRRYNTPEFVNVMKRAKVEAVERLEAEAWRRARDSSDTLLIFLLKGLKPKMYRENIKVTLEYGLAPDKLNPNLRRLVEQGGIAPESLGEAFEEWVNAYLATVDADTGSGAASSAE